MNPKVLERIKYLDDKFNRRKDISQQNQNEPQSETGEEYITTEVRWNSQWMNLVNVASPSLWSIGPAQTAEAETTSQYTPTATRTASDAATEQMVIDDYLRLADTWRQRHGNLRVIADEMRRQAAISRVTPSPYIPILRRGVQSTD